jgi:hypothetical protein
MKKNLFKVARLVASATIIVIFFVLFKPKTAKAFDVEDLNFLQRIELSPPRRNKWSQETPGMEKGRQVASMKKEQRRQRQDEALAEYYADMLGADMRRHETRKSKFPNVDQRWKGEGLSHDKSVQRDLLKARKMVSRIDPQLLKSGPWASNVSFEEQHEIALNEIRGWTSQSRWNEIMVFSDDVEDPMDRSMGCMLTTMDGTGTGRRGQEPTIEERLAGTIFVDEEARVRFYRDKIEREPTYRLPDPLVYSIVQNVDAKRQLARSIKFIEQIVEEGADNEPPLVRSAINRFTQAQKCVITTHRAKRAQEILFMALPLADSSNLQDLVLLSWTKNSMLMKGSSRVAIKANLIGCEADADQKFYNTLRNKTHEAAVEAKLNDPPGSQIVW